MGGAISALTVGEIRRGIDLITGRDPAQAKGLESWLHGLYANFADRILPVTAEIAEEWGRLNAIRPLPAVDSLLAATANVHNLTFADTERERCSRYWLERDKSVRLRGQVVLTQNHLRLRISTRVVHNGSYQTGMANIQCMYAPEFNSHSESLPIEVR